MSNMYQRQTRMAQELRKGHSKPLKLLQLDAINKYQHSSLDIPNDTSAMMGVNSHCQMEGGGSNSNINSNDQQDYNTDNHQQQYQNYKQHGSLPKPKITQYIPQQKEKKQSDPQESHNIYQMYPSTPATNGLISSSQPASSTNLYSLIDGGKSSREAVLPGMLSNHQLQGIQSHQHQSATNLNQVSTLGNRKTDEQSFGNSVGIKSSANVHSNSKSNSKRNYLYCVDTRQIITMIDFCIKMISVPCKEINKTIETLERQQKLKFGGINGKHQQIDISKGGHRSKSSNEIQSKKGMGSKLTNPQTLYMETNLDDTRTSVLHNNQLRTDIFCSGNNEMTGLTLYFNQKLKSLIENSKTNQKSGLFKMKAQDHNSKKDLSKDDSLSSLDFCKIFSLDTKTQNNIVKFANHNNYALMSGPQNFDNSNIGLQFLKFTYLVENEKILSKQMFYIDVQRDSFGQTLKEIKELLTSFIERKYKNCITKIGFSSQNELFNIFNKMFNSKKGFFNNVFVRKVLHCFWMSIREIFFQIRLKQFEENPNTANFKVISKLSLCEEMMLKNNFYMRLELLARGRQIYEPYQLDLQMQHLHNFIVPLSQQSGSLLDKQSSGSLTTMEFSYAKLYPLHQAIFDSNLRMLSKLLKQEIEGMFFINKNTLDPCGNTPLMLAIKLGNLDAVKILSDVYTCPKLRSLPDLMNAKEVAIAMKHQPILKILISSNQKIKQQFFEDNKNAIFSELESFPDFKVDLNLTCDSNLFPVFSSVAPNDTYKIYKQGSNLRLDMTLLGLQGFNLMKGNITVIYKGRNSNDRDQAGDLLIIDNKLQTVSNVFNRNQENKVNTEIQNILTGKQVLKKYQTHSSSINIETERSNKPIFKNINDYECQKYILKSKYTMTKYQMNLNQIDQIKGLKNFQEYVENLEIDYLQLMESTLNCKIREQNPNPQTQERASSGNFFTNRFKVNSSRGEKYETSNFGVESILNTSRVNLGGTSKINNPGELSSREGSNIRNLAGEGRQSNQQMYTQEDKLNNNSSVDRLGGIFAHRGSSQTQNNMLANNKQINIKKMQQKQIQANLWLCKTYPFDIEQFLPLFHVLSFCSKQIRQFNKFLLKYPLPKNSFPVEARIPLMMTMEAVFSFKNLQLGFKDSKVFELDKEVAKKQQENMAIYAKQQISYLNQHSSLDTQEDKQAKALREIYKLCATDEGESGDNYNGNYDLYKIYEANEKAAKANEDGNGSDSSDIIKDRFDKMKDETYDINKDNVLIQENDHQMQQNQKQKLKRSRVIQKEKEEDEVENVIQSRNFTSKSSFHDLKKSLTQSEFIKMRKSNGNGRTPSMQFSLQSDITESIEVSERSFNDKLAKLQIHSFQNVKFMSQLKKNKDQNIDKNLEQILNQQFMINSKPTKRQQLKNNKNMHEGNFAQVDTLGLQLKNQLSNMSQGSINMENIYDSKINEQRPKINKSLGKHQIKNNLHMYAKNMKSQAIEFNNGKPPMVIHPSKTIRPKHVAPNLGYNQSVNSIGTTADDSVLFQKPILRQPQLKQNNFIQQPNANIGNSTVSMGISNLDNSSLNLQSMSSMSLANLEQRNAGQLHIHSSTNDSSKINQSLGSSLSQHVINPSTKQTRVLNNLRFKMLIRNQNGNQNYLNTIESEGNLPTQQFGKGDHKNTKDCNNLSQRSIHSLDEAEEESINRNANQRKVESQDNVIPKNKTTEGISLDGLSSYDHKQIFSYEKQKLNLQEEEPEQIMQSYSQFNANSVGPQKPAQGFSKLNFFQKVTNFISESITDRKHHNSGGNTNIDQSIGDQYLIHSNTSSKNQVNSLIEDRKSNDQDLVGNGYNRQDLITSNKSQSVLVNEKSFIYKKTKKQMITPKNNQFVSPLRQFSGPGTAGRDNFKKQKAMMIGEVSDGNQQQLANSIRNSQHAQIQGSSNTSAIHLQQMINNQLIKKKGSLKGGPNISVTKPLEPHRNTTQTDGSDKKHTIAPSAFLVDDQSPLREGQIHNFNKLH